ncbi:hypothetical protein DH2020_000301 [Rehmannia glutinosa]|uniref:Piwi domain-containing protein n=1 Tax=Rehmannia glutinosa TaxID=99300 RepID=A0ABR0XW43_REHGL
MEEKLTLQASSSSQVPPRQPQDPAAVAVNPPPVQQQLAPVSSKALRPPARPGFGKIWTEDHSEGQPLFGELPFTSKDFVVKLIDKDGGARREREFKVSIKFASKADIHHLQQFIHGRQNDAPKKLYRLLMCYTVVGRSFFDPQLGEIGELGNGLQYWKGFYQSLDQPRWACHLILICRPEHFEPLLVSEYVAKYLNRDLTRPLSDQDRLKVKRALKVCVQATELLSACFPWRSLVEVYLLFSTSVKYNIALKYLFLPALQAGSATRPIYLPMELSRIVAGQRYSKKLNERQVTALLKATCQRSRDRETSISDMVRYNNYDGDQLVKTEFGIQVNPQLTSIEARVLPAPTLRYHATGRQALVDPSVGQWNMIDKEFNPSPLVPTRLAHSGQIEKALSDIHLKSKIKRVCETELGIVSQCCQPRQAAKLSKQYMENVALKINVKVGGRNTVMEQVYNKMPYLTDRPTIVFGADVTHPSPGEDSSPSIAAVVASMDWPEVTKYRGLVSAQAHREEIIQDLYNTKQDPKRGTIHGGMIREHLIAFYKSTGIKPHRIIFYRDGVSEGQFNQVLLHEMDAIRKACVSIEATYMPRVTFVVVQKRHHTRLFPATHGDRHTTDRRATFCQVPLLIPRYVIPMSSTFTSVAMRESSTLPCFVRRESFTADALQMLTNSLCYTYARCTRSVSIVPPAYYAHLAAFRARYYIEGTEMSDSGSTAGAVAGATRDRNAEVRPLPVIKENVKDVMFYC